MADSGQSETETADLTPTGGAALREAREARGVPIEEIATELRIEARLLEALEREDYPALGAPVFAKGYIRQYASRLGLDAVPLVAAYNEATGAVDVRIEPSRSIKLRDGQQITAWIIAVLAIALVAVFLAVWWFSTPAPVGRPAALADPGNVPFPDAAVGNAAATPVERQRAAPEAANSAADSGDAAGGEPAVVPAVPGGAQPSAAAPTESSGGPAPATSSAAGAAQDVLAGAAGSAVPLAAAVPPATAAVDSSVASSRGPTVELQFSADCWVEIEDANGERLLYGLIPAGSRRVITGAAPIDVFLGDGEAARITVDGGEFAVPPSTRRDNVVRFAIPAATD